MRLLGGRAGKAIAAAAGLMLIAAAVAVAGLIPVPVEYETDTRPMDVVVGKVNAGAAKDIAVAHRDGRSVSVLRGGGDGDFAEADTYETLGLRATGVAIAKVNGDGRPDLVVAGDDTDPGGDRLLVLRGRAGGLRPPQDFPLPTVLASDVAVGDLDRDGRVDAVVGDANSSSIVVKYGKGNGAFGKSRKYGFPFPPPDGDTPTEPQFVAIADYDRDGFKDIAVAIGRRTDVGVLYTKTKRKHGKRRALRGRFRQRSYDTDGLPYGIATGDLNGDGRLDIAVPNDYNVGAESISVLYGKGRRKQAGFRPPQEIDVGDEPFGAIAIGRFNPGPRRDIAVSTNTSGIAYLYGEAGGFSAPLAYGLAEPGISMAAARLNGDGEDDLALGQWNEGNVLVILEED